MVPSINERLKRRVEAAQGKIACDLQIKNTKYYNAFTATWQTADISIIDGTIISLLRGLKAKRTLTAPFTAPGFIDAHVHLESSLMIPKNFQTTVLPKGTT